MTNILPYKEQFFRSLQVKLNDKKCEVIEFYVDELFEKRATSYVVDAILLSIGDVAKDKGFKVMSTLNCDGRVFFRLSRKSSFNNY